MPCFDDLWGDKLDLPLVAIKSKSWQGYNKTDKRRQHKLDLSKIMEQQEISSKSVKKKGKLNQVEEPVVAAFFHEHTSILGNSSLEIIGKKVNSLLCQIRLILLVPNHSRCLST